MGNKHNKITNEFPGSPLDSLSKACQKGMDENMNEIKLILEQHPELINETILPRNLPPLLLACDFLPPGSQMLEYLLSNYSSTIRVNERNQIGCTALIMATMFKKVDCVKLLLEHPDIDVNAKDYHDNVTALYHAIHRKFTECVKLLLKHPNIDVKDATYQALIYDRVEYVEMLVNHPNLDPHEKDKLLWHCRGKECFNFLLPYYPTLNEYEKKMALVHCLCNMWKGSLDEVKELMKGFPREILIQMRDDLSKAVHIAAGKSHNMRIFDFLFSSYSDIIDVNYQSEKYGWTILHETMKFDGGGLTARSKDPKPLKLLLAHPNIDINRQDADGNTPLHRALYFGNENYVKILLNDPRIDLTIRDKYGRTPDEMNCSFNRKNGRNLSSRKSIFQSFKWEWIVPLVSISVVFSSIWIMRYYYKGIS